MPGQQLPLLLDARHRQPFLPGLLLCSVAGLSAPELARKATTLMESAVSSSFYPFGIPAPAHLQAAWYWAGDLPGSQVAHQVSEDNKYPL
jgi:hypothetical protein